MIIGVLNLNNCILGVYSASKTFLIKYRINNLNVQASTTIKCLTAIGQSNCYSFLATDLHVFKSIKTSINKMSTIWRTRQSSFYAIRVLSTQLIYSSHGITLFVFVEADLSYKLYRFLMIIMSIFYQMFYRYTNHICY